MAISLGSTVIDRIFRYVILPKIVTRESLIIRSWFHWISKKPLSADVLPSVNMPWSAMLQILINLMNEKKMDTTESTSTNTVDPNTSEGFTVPDSSSVNPKPTLTHTMEKNVTQNDTKKVSHQELPIRKSVETPEKSKPVESPKKTAPKGRKPAGTKPKPKAPQTVPLRPIQPAKDLITIIHIINTH